MESDAKWLLPENLRAQEQRERAEVERGEFAGGGDFGSYYAFRTGANTEFARTHAIIEDWRAVSYARNVGALLVARMGLKLGGRLLDVGCGVGSITHALAEYSGAQAIGLDIAEDAIAVAQERYPSHAFHHQSADDLGNFDDDSFDVIHAREFYPFTRTNDADYQKQYLDLFRTKLRPGGYVVLYMARRKRGFSKAFQSTRRDRDSGWARLMKSAVVPRKLHRVLGDITYRTPLHGMLALALRGFTMARTTLATDVYVLVNPEP